MIGILLVAALLVAGFFHSPLFSGHKKALVTWLVQLVSPCCKPTEALASTFPLEASLSCRPTEKEKDVVVQQPVPAPAGPDLELESVFRTFDNDGDGFITANELEESLRRLGLPAGGVKEMLQRVDSNGDGLIDMDEFRELYESIAGGRRRKKEMGSQGDAEGTIRILDADDDEDDEEIEGVDQEEAELREAFGVFDRDGDGLIGTEELMAVLGSTRLRSGATEAECREMIEQVDLDGDGMVNFHEFKRMMMLRVPSQPNQAEKGKLL